MFAGAEPVDFRTMIHTLPIPGRRLDPADRNAYRCHWGGALTADGREAEIATPPVPLAPGYALEVVRSTDRGRQCLRDVLPDGLRLEGYSTHINLSVPDRRLLRTARLFAYRFAPAVMLLMDGPGSPGLLVRPRPGRLELGGDYVDGEALRAVVVLAAGAALACARSGPRRLPAALDVVITPAVERFGSYIDRTAFGADLYDLGRDCPLRTATGKPRTAQRHLQHCWRIARSAVRPHADPADLELVDDLVDGRRPLPLERGRTGRTREGAGDDR